MDDIMVVNGDLVEAVPRLSLEVRYLKAVELFSKKELNLTEYKACQLAGIHHTSFAA
jgi:hypothetical protein